jgi:hypothetical protein
VLTQSSGINMSPLPQPVLLGRVGKPGLAAQTMEELERGSLMSTDLGDDWDFWPYAPMPLGEARRRLGIAPRQ